MKLSKKFIKKINEFQIMKYKSKIAILSQFYSYMNFEIY